MSLIQNNSYTQNVVPYNNKLVSRTTYTSPSPTTTGTVLSIPNTATLVLCKLWGAGAGGGAGLQPGGGGGYTTLTFIPNPNCSYVISVGRSGLASGSSNGGNILPGGSGTAAAAGGDATILAELFNGTYTLLAVAGGGGGTGTGGGPPVAAGGGGNNAGQSTTGFGGSGGSGGTLNGANCNSTASTLPALGGQGGSDPGTNYGGGGGGYGGGGAGSPNGGGGGGYVSSGTTYTTVTSTGGSTGNGQTAGNSSDPDNTANYGQGGNVSSNGNGGFFVVYYLTYGGVIGIPSFVDNTTAPSGNLYYFGSNFFREPVLSATNSSVTTTTASTVTIQGPPKAGINETITNSYALDVISGNTHMAGPVTMDSSATVGLGGTAFFLIQRGSFQFTTSISASGSTQSPAQTFTTPFSSTPQVFFTITPPLNGNYWDQTYASTYSVTTTGFAATLHNTNTSNSTSGTATIYWMAIL